MTWLLVALIVVVIYNAEKLPQLMTKLKDDVPHLVEAGKKASKELKEKAQAMQKEKSTSAKKETSKKTAMSSKEDNNE